MPLWNALLFCPKCWKKSFSFSLYWSFQHTLLNIHLNILLNASKHYFGLLFTYKMLGTKSRISNRKLKLFHSGEFSYPYFFLKFLFFTKMLDSVDWVSFLYFYSFFSSNFLVSWRVTQLYDLYLMLQFPFLLSYLQEMIFQNLWIVNIIRSCSCFINIFFLFLLGNYYNSLEFSS